MKMSKIAGSKNDEYFTPSYAVEPIVKYLKLKTFKKIWCPFDLPESNFVKVLQSNNFEVIYSHIDNDEDFFKTEKDCDVIVSNPPYSLKEQVITRLFELKKPFAMLIGIAGLFDSKARFNLLKNNQFEMMIFNKRIAFFQDMIGQRALPSPPYNSIYLTSNILPEKIIFQEFKNG